MPAKVKGGMAAQCHKRNRQVSISWRNAAVGHQNSTRLSNQQLQITRQAISIGVTVTALFAMLAYLRAFFIVRHCLALEAIALSAAACGLQAQTAAPKLNRFHRLFWVVIRRI